jgi:deazaflavin-dependent oxidoreductase (nitroreductase family)
VERAPPAGLRQAAGTEIDLDVEVPWYIPLMDRLNPLVVAVLRSRMHWLASAGLMALTVTGRRSGRIYTIPVGYHDFGDAIVVMVSNAAERSWWRNFLEPREAELRVRGRRIRATGEVLAPGSDEFLRRVEQVFSRARFISGIFHVDFDREAGLTQVQADALGHYAAVVRFTAIRSPEERQ